MIILFREKNSEDFIAMPHPVLIPLLLIPHVLIPVGLIYVIYLDQQETITRVRSGQTRTLLSTIPPAPPVPPALVHPCTSTTIYAHSNTIRKLISLDSSASYNCHSPMSWFARENYNALKEQCDNHLFRYYQQRIYKTPMRDLVQTKQFQRELETSYNESVRHAIWKDYFYSHVLSKVTIQHGYVLSKLSRFLRQHVIYSLIDNELRVEKYVRMQASPMYHLAHTEPFKEQLSDRQTFREVDREYMETNPIHILTLKEQDNIKDMARRMSFTRNIRTSRMHQFIHHPWNRISIVYQASCNVERSARMTSSPLRKWTFVNGTLIRNCANRINEIRLLRTQTLKQIGDLLSKNYGTLYRRYTLSEFRRHNHIPEVQFHPSCASYANIIFPQDVQIIDRFLADSNLDGFAGCTIYTDKNHYHSYATSLLITSQGIIPTINDLTDAAQTFKNISHLTHEDTQVQILSDSGKIQCNDQGTSSLERKVEFYFVKRDRCEFSIKDYKTCYAKVVEFLRRYPDLTFTLGFVGRWLGETMLITLSGPYESQKQPVIKYNNLCTDLIQIVNLVKGVIFQKVMDRVCWIHLPPLKHEA